MKKIVAISSILVAELYSTCFMGYYFMEYGTPIFLYLLISFAILTMISSIVSVVLLEDKKMDRLPKDNNCPYYIDKEISKDE